MKKTLIIVIAALALCATAAAQPKALGIRFGWGGMVSYEHYLGGANFLELDAGLYGWNGVNIDVDASYNFMIAQPNWTPRGEWGFYIGPGVAVGTYAGPNGAAFNIGAFAQIGLEYTFWFPLNISLDIRPGYYFMNKAWGYYPALSLRYAF